MALCRFSGFSFLSLKCVCQPTICVSSTIRMVRVFRWPTVDNPWVDLDLQKKPTFEKRTYPVKYRSEPSLFQHVARILPQDTIPDPSTDTNFPTPSGWMPPNVEKALQQPYIVQRSRCHMLPVYFEETERKKAEQTFGKRRFTVVKNIDGDIWKLDADLRALLEPRCEGPYLAQVSEIGRRIKIEGLFQDVVAQFLLDKGF